MAKGGFYNFSFLRNVSYFQINTNEIHKYMLGVFRENE